MNPIENSSICQSSETLSIGSTVPTITTAPAYTLSQWLNEWLETYKSSTVSLRTIAIYRSVMVIIQRHTEAQASLSSITERQLQKLLNRIHGERYEKSGWHFYSKSTMNKIRMTLQQAFRCAYRLRLISSNPASDLILPSAQTKEVLPLTQEQQDRVERACEKDVLGHLMIFLLRTGLRRFELTNLQWQDYDAGKGTVLVRVSKTPAGIRTVCLLDEARRIIESQPKSIPIFSTPHGICPLPSLCCDGCMSVFER